MPRPHSVHRCVECGATTPRWAGRCPTCGEWDALVEEALEVPGGRMTAPAVEAPPLSIADIDTHAAPARPTGIGELDRVLGGGLVPGSVTLVGGEPGVGKSTLLLQAMTALVAGGARCLLISAEESPAQVRRRADRLGAIRDGLWLTAERGLAGIGAAIEQVEPDVVVIDSIQTIHDEAIDSMAGSVAQVRGCAQTLVQLAKAREMATVLVGHVTKEGAVAGPRVLEHVVDTVLTFEGEAHHALRLLRAVKHRFGPTGELGLFEMADEGLVGVPDPGGLFLGDRHAGAPGSVVFPAIEGQRPLLVEVQALVMDTPMPVPRRSGQGLDAGRLAMLAAVLDRRTGVKLGKDEVFASAIGGVRISEPGADLAIALSLASAKFDRPVAPQVVACGEIGLVGEVRQVNQMARRLAEAARLGFTTALVPRSAPDGPAGLRTVRVGTVAEALEAAGLVGATGSLTAVRSSMAVC